MPKPILSKRFDCPYATDERCAAVARLALREGGAGMDGRRALIYSRIRQNQLDPSETDIDARRAAAGRC